MKDKWREKWSYDSPFNCELINDPTLPVEGFNLDRDIWVKVNRIRSGHGRCFDCLYKWIIKSSPVCHCGLGNQTMAHIVCSCPLRRFSGDYNELCKISSQRAMDWLRCLDLNL